MLASPAPPILLEDLIDDLDAVVDLFERSAPHTPLGGWFRPDRDGGEATSPMWFQTDWVHADFAIEGADLFFRNERVIEAARAFCDAEVVVPHTVYVNLMAAIAECGPAHTDNPVFRGRNRTNTPMLLLRTMLWSGLFDRWVIPQVTSIWWLNNVEGGGFSYWPEGPEKPPQRHAGAMANTALVGDNHRMFHQVKQDLLSLEDVARIFDEDLARRGADLRFDLERLNDPALALALGAIYPEPVPVGAGVSMFDVHR
jgi:hypothetical protein